ncbi:MAG: PhzF family phenazine biosynthesis protein [Candidatus Eremiobacterota bacterium]
MGLKIIQVDAFTDEPFKGNPAAVCILEQEGNEEWMQKVAREMNLSETAFLYKKDSGYSLRWFTPAVEVELCGHATLASAHVLWEEGHLKHDETACFYTRSGMLKARKKDDWIEMDFPAREEHEIKEYPELAEALGIKAGYIGKAGTDYLVEVSSEETVREVKPDFTLLKKLKIRAVIITAVSSAGEYDFISRFFAPGAGVDEDPVTGSAHCVLGPFWSKKLNKNELTGYQASPRGGTVRVRAGGERVYLAGQAVTVLKGEFLT